MAFVAGMTNGATMATVDCGDVILSSEVV